MAIKEFNAKQFLLEKGEWVGLGVALLIALPVSRPRPDDDADEP